MQIESYIRNKERQHQHFFGKFLKIKGYSKNSKMILE
jgi:hypothetical protein